MKEDGEFRSGKRTGNECWIHFQRQSNEECYNYRTQCDGLEPSKVKYNMSDEK